MARLDLVGLIEGEREFCPANAAGNCKFNWGRSKTQGSSTTKGFNLEAFGDIGKSNDNFAHADATAGFNVSWKKIIKQPKTLRCRFHFLAVNILSPSWYRIAGGSKEICREVLFSPITTMEIQGCLQFGATDLKLGGSLGSGQSITLTVLHIVVSISNEGALEFLNSMKTFVEQCLVRISTEMHIV